VCVYDLSEAKTSRGQTVECHKGQHESAGRLLKILRKEEHNQSVFFFLFFFLHIIYNLEINCFEIELWQN